MGKYFIYVTSDSFDIKVYGRQIFLEDGMLCCANPAMAIPCKLGDVFVATVSTDVYGESVFDIRQVQTPQSLNSFVAWLCGFNSDRRCPAWRWKYNRPTFKSHTHHPTDLRTLDERVLHGKLYLAVVRSVNANNYPTRLWAGIDTELVDATDILTIADLIVPRVRTDWVVLKLKEFGVEMDAATLHRARGLGDLAAKEAGKK